MLINVHRKLIRHCVAFSVFCDLKVPNDEMDILQGIKSERATALDGLRGRFKLAIVDKPLQLLLSHVDFAC